MLKQICFSRFLPQDVNHSLMDGEKVWKRGLNISVSAYFVFRLNYKVHFCDFTFKQFHGDCFVNVPVPLFSFLGSVYLEKTETDSNFLKNPCK